MSNVTLLIAAAAVVWFLYTENKKAHAKED
jgi:hypothetical protein